MLNYLKEHGSEVVNMLFTEFNMEDAKAVWLEEGERRGEARGVKKLLNLLRKGYSVDEAEKRLKIS